MVSFDDNVGFPPDLIQKTLIRMWVFKRRLSIVCLWRFARCDDVVQLSSEFPARDIISDQNTIHSLGSVYWERGLNILLESKALSPSHIAVSCDSSISVVAWEGILPFQFCSIFYYMHGCIHSDWWFFIRSATRLLFLKNAWQLATRMRSSDLSFGPRYQICHTNVVTCEAQVLIIDIMDPTLTK